jgi:TolC family type I secretion outer membrane protein
VLQTTREALSLSQNLYSGGEAAASLARADSEVQAERARLMELEQQVLLAAIDAFVRVAAGQAVLDLARDNERRLALHQEGVRDRERFGDLTKVDLAQARSRAARATADRIAAEGDLRMALADYQRVAGAAPERLELPAAPDDLPRTLAEALAAASRSWRLLAAEAEVRAAQDDVEVARAALKPRLTLQGELSYVDEPSALLDSQSGASIGAVLAVPLYRGGSDQARVRQSKEVLTQRRYAQDDMARSVEAQITAAWDRSATAADRLQSVQVQLDAATFAVEGVRQEALVGTRSVLEMLDAEEELFRAQVELARGEAERVLAAFGLRAAMAELTAGALDLPVAAYDPDAHLERARGRWFGTAPATGG